MLNVWLPAYTSHRPEKHTQMPSAREPETRSHLRSGIRTSPRQEQPRGHSRRDSSEVTGDAGGLGTRLGPCLGTVLRRLDDLGILTAAWLPSNTPGHVHHRTTLRTIRSQIPACSPTGPARCVLNGMHRAGTTILKLHANMVSTIKYDPTAGPAVVTFCCSSSLWTPTVLSLPTIVSSDQSRRW